MKKFLAAVCIGVMAMSATVYGSDISQSGMPFTDNILEDGSIIYYFEDVAIVLPEDWNGKYGIETEGNSATFYHKASREKWMENYNSKGGNFFTLSCSVNHDFAELPDFYYIGFDEESVMNYFLTFPTDFQAYAEDSAITEEFQQMNSEIEFVKTHAYMLGQGGTGSNSDDNTTSASVELIEGIEEKMGTEDPSEDIETNVEFSGAGSGRIIGKIGAATEKEYWFDETTAGYNGTWVTMEGGFQLYLPSDWNYYELTEEEIERGYSYLAASEDESEQLAIRKIEVEVGLSVDEILDIFADGETGAAEIAKVNGTSCVKISGEEEYLIFPGNDSRIVHLIVINSDRADAEVDPETILCSMCMSEES